MVNLNTYSKEIVQLCEDHRVKTLYAFGSVFTDHFNSESDIDLVVDFLHMAPEEYADNYFNLKFSLRDIFKRPIDLLEEKAIKNPYFIRTIHKQRSLVYGQ